MKPRFRRKPQAAWAMVAAVVLVAVVRLAVYWFEPPPSPARLDETTYRVHHVVDGDTLKLTNGAYVRLIGVNSPETKKEGVPAEPWGPEATAFSEAFVRRGGGKVRLRLDREREDQYGRMLAYVYVGDKLLNEELVRAGFAEAWTHFNYSESFKKRFRLAEREARQARRGIWSDTP